SAAMTINPAGVIDASTYTAGKAFQITNTGQKDIASITFNLATTNLRNILFDPAGTAGDLTAKNLTIDSSGNTGAVQPAARDYSIFAGGRAGGYEAMTISFNAAVAGGFNAGETVKFSIDIDPTSIKDSGVDGDAGSISGAELTGATVIVTYADGSTQTSAIFGDGSQGGAKATWSETEPAAPVLSIGGLSSGSVAVTTQTQTVSVSGAANATVKVMVTTGGMGNNVQPVDIFDANKAIAIDYRTVVLDGGGHGSFQLDLPPQNPIYLSAAIDQAGAAGAVSAGLVVAWDTDTRSYLGTSGADAFTGAAGRSWIVSGLNGNDILTTAEKDDKVDGGGGNDTISTRAGDDVITYSGAATGNDIVDGGDGIDRIEALGNNSVIGLASIRNVEAITAGGWTGVRILGTGGADAFDFSAVALTGISLIDLGKGDDVFFGSAGDDVVAGGEGNDILHGGMGNDVFRVAGATGADLLYGDGGYDRIVAVAANATINGLGLNGIEEISAAGFANVAIVGSGGNDVLDLGATQLVGIAAISAGNGNDTVNGSASGDVIVGGGGNDILRGRAGDDIFQIGAGAGTDLIDGEGGFDRIVAVADNAVIGLSYIGGIEEVSASGFSGVRIVGSGNADTLDFGNVGLVGVISIDGGNGDDVIGGSAGADIISGGSGNDRLYGAGGNDIFQIGSSAGIDAIDGGDGIDQIMATANNVTIGGLGLTSIEQVSAAGFSGVKIGGTSAGDLLDFRAINLVGIVSIDANAGDDVIHGSNGSDVILAGGGNDGLFGHDGDDVFQVASSAGVDGFDGGGGYDRIVAINNNVSINPFGLSGIEEISANGLSGVALLGDGNANILDFSAIALIGVAINGGGGNDAITGSADADVIIGGSGGDSLRGGGGADIFDYNSTSESRTTAIDRILDFEQGVDRFDLSTIDANSKVSGNQAFTFIGSAAFSGVAGQMRFEAGATSTSIFVDTDGNRSVDMEIRLDGHIEIFTADVIL
ncbi:MAG: calcium-binding protein, partial [Sphingomonas sp.]